MPQTKQRPVKVLKKITIDKNGCWNWYWINKKTGYGIQGIKGRPKLAHRWFYEIYNGKIDEGQTIDHLCRNRACVNPSHLEAVSHKENVLRGISPSAINATKQYCKNNHILFGDNLYIKPNGSRNCKTCRSVAMNNWRLRFASN